MTSPANIIGIIKVDGHEVPVVSGDTFGACLLRAGLLIMRRSRTGQLRGMYCAIGVCNECLLTVDGRQNVRACVTRARPGAQIETGGSAHS